MTAFLKKALLITGALTALLFLMPGLIIYASLALIVPGLVLAVVPTAFLYLCIFSLAWLTIGRASRPAAAALGIAAVAALAVAVPDRLNDGTRARLAEAAARDSMPGTAMTARVVGLQPPRASARDACDDLCQLLLYSGAAEGVLSLPAASEPAGDARRPQTPPMLFRVIRQPHCDRPEALARSEHAYRWTGDRARDIEKAARLRIAGGECLVGVAAPGTSPDLLIRRVEETVGTKPSRLALGAGEARVDALELVMGEAVVARGSHRAARLLSIPLFLEPYGYGLDLRGWEWARREEASPALDVVALLQRFTAFALDGPRGPDASGLRRSLDAALADPSLPASAAPFQLVPDYFDLLRGGGVGADDIGRLARIVGEGRITGFWHFPYSAFKHPDAGALRDPIIDRLGRLMAQGRSEGFRSHESYRALEALVRALPEGAFSEPDPRVDALIDDPGTRSLSPNLIYRLVDQGVGVATRLLALMREDWTGAVRGAGGRRQAGGKAAQASLLALCRLGTVAAEHLPALRALAAEGLVPPGTLQGDLWRVTLVRLGAGVEEFDKPASLSGTAERYRERLRAQAARPCDNL